MINETYRDLARRILYAVTVESLNEIEDEILKCDYLTDRERLILLSKVYAKEQIIS